MEEKKKTNEFTLADTNIPSVFPPTTKKFVEVRTGEIIYLKENGEGFY